VVRKLIQGEDVPPLTARRAEAKLSREQDVLLQGMLASAAYQKLRQGRQVEWTFSEACKFWAIGDRVGDAIDARLDELQAQLTAIERALASGMQPLGNGLQVTVREAGQLCDLHQQLEQRFTRHLQLLRSRA